MIASNFLTATETQALLARGETTTDQILSDHHARYQERDDQVKAWVCVDHSRAAKEVAEGSLKGIVIGIKDIISQSPSSRDCVCLEIDHQTPRTSRRNMVQRYIKVIK